MIKRYAVLLAGLLAALPALSSFAAEFSRLGDPAPPLPVKAWVKGRPVDFQAGSNIYVLVFCTLSRANDFALTNLNSLQQTYHDKGVEVVAISAEPVEALKEFVQIKHEKISFSVAADDDARAATSSYQRAFKQMMLPRAYVIGRDGKVLWLGHPLTGGLGYVIEDITSGHFDLAQSQAKIKAAEQMEQYLILARQEDPRTAQAGQIMLTIRTNDAAALCDLAYQIATAPYIQKRDVAVATAALDRAAQLPSANAVDIAVDRAILLFQTGKETEGLALAKSAMALIKTDADKDEVKNCISNMEARLAAPKTSQTGSVTNSSSPSPN